MTPQEMCAELVLDFLLRAYFEVNCKAFDGVWEILRAMGKLR